MHTGLTSLFIWHSSPHSPLGAVVAANKGPQVALMERAPGYFYVSRFGTIIKEGAYAGRLGQEIRCPSPNIERLHAIVESGTASNG